MNSAASMPLPLIEIKDQHERGLGLLTVARAAQRVALPLTGVKISARVADRVAGVTLTETFRNPYPEHLEAVYIFPLPGGAAVSDFLMRVGARVIRGKVEERAEARRQYQQAIDAGKRAALLEKERDDLFTVQVGNIPPGEEITIELSYSESLPFFEDGLTELRLPLVVAPRYIPGNPLARDQVGEGTELDTDIVPDASRITPPRLAEGFDPKVALGIEVELLREGALGAGDISDLCCSQHATRSSIGSGGIKVSLARTDEPLDRDFVLRWSLAGSSVRTTLLCHRDEDGNRFGLLAIIPPRPEGVPIVPRDVVFVVDRSGSMQGVKMASAARACAILLATLGPQDRFAIQAFDNVTEWLMPTGSVNGRDYFISADQAGIEKGEKYLRGINARGGTELNGAISDALATINARANQKGRVPVVVVLTDGEIGDESRVLKQIQQGLGDTRVFSVGIDTAVNQGFLQRLADLGRGTATFVEPGLQLEDALRSVGREIGSPLIVNVSIQDIDAGLQSDTIAPSRVPDLFAGRAVTAFFSAKKAGRVRVKGRFTSGGEFEAVVEAKEIQLPALAQLWARTRITDLEDRFRTEPHQQQLLREQIIKLALHHTLLTRFTAFVVVDESEIVNKDGTKRKMVQPVEMPARWEMGKELADQSLNVGSGQQKNVCSIGPMMADIESEATKYPTGSLTQAGGAPMPPMPKASMPMSQPASSAPPPLLKKAESRAKSPASPAAPRPNEQRQQAEGSEAPGLLSRALDAVTNLFRREGKEKSSDSPELVAFQTALKNFTAELKVVYAEISAGRIPPVWALEQARAALLIGLSGKADQLPKLKAFLDSGALDLINSLKSAGATVANLQPICQVQEIKFYQALKEVEEKYGQPKNAQAFWESSI